MSEPARVIVVGAGPVGLMTALCLARREVPVLVLEAGRSELDMQWRGSTLHPPTLEILDLLGLVEPVLSGAIHVTRLQYRDLELDTVAELRLDVLAESTRFPIRLQYEQYKMLGLLRSAVERSPHVVVRYGDRVTDVEQHDDGVQLTVATPDGPAVMEAEWVIAADGSHSVIRNRLGIEFPGTTFARPSIVAATALQLGEHIADLAPVSYWSGPGGRLSLIHTPDVWRVAISVERTDGDGSSYGSADAPHPRLVELLRALLGDKAGLAFPLLQHDVYESHQRVASTFRQGRVLLVGDAAHITATTGGMGLNSGIHDAWAIAHAVALGVEAGTDHPAVESSAISRRNTALNVVQHATSGNRKSADVDVLADRISRLDALRATFGDPDSCRRFAERTAMLDAVADLHLDDPSTATR